jgi:hypothetical protein
LAKKESSHHSKQQPADYVADGTAWNRSSYDEIIAMQNAVSGSSAPSPHQVTGGVVDQDDENYDLTAIK